MYLSNSGELGVSCSGNSPHRCEMSSFCTWVMCFSLGVSRAGHLRMKWCRFSYSIRRIRQVAQNIKTAPPPEVGALFLYFAKSSWSVYLPTRILALITF